MSFSMLEPLKPLPIINFACIISHFSFAVLFPIKILALINVSVAPAVHTISMFFTLLPISIICFAVISFIFKLSIEVIIFKISSIDTPFVVKSPFPIFLVIQKLSYITRTIRIARVSRAIWNVVFPLACILKAFFANVSSVSICNIIFKITLIIASINFDKTTISFTTTIYKNPFQQISIIEIQLSIAMRLSIFNFTHIFCLQTFHNYFFIFSQNIFKLRSSCRRKMLISSFYILIRNLWVMVRSNLMQP